MTSTMSQWPKIRQLKRYSRNTMSGNKNIQAISWYEYSPSEEILRVKWSGNDKTYDYQMSPEKYAEFDKASSKGSWLNAYYKRG